MEILKLKRKDRIGRGLLKIGEIANEAGLLPSCVRFYTQMGFLKIEALTKGGYWLYKKTPTLKALAKVAVLVKKGHTLDEIKNGKHMEENMGDIIDTDMAQRRPSARGIRMSRLFSFIIFMALACALNSQALAGDIEAKLNSNDGSTNFEVRDSLNAVKAQIDSSGNTLVKGGLRLGAAAVEHTVAGELIADGKIGVGTITPDALIDIEAAEDTERLRLTDSTNVDSVGIYVGTGSPSGALAAQMGSLFLDEAGALYLNTDGANTWTQFTTGGGGNYWSRAGTAISPAIAGDTLRLDASSYFNFGAAAGAAGYGIRDNAGVIELKNSGGGWSTATGANTALSNLAAVTTINTSLVSDTNNTDDLGTALIKWQDLYLSQVAYVGTKLGILESGGGTDYTYFQAGVQAGDITYTLPTASANGYMRNTAGVLSWDTPTVAAGGNNTELQYNNAGSLGGLSKLTWDGTDFLLGTAAATKLQIRDNAIYINSADDGHLDLTADTSIDLNSTVDAGANTIKTTGIVQVPAINGGTADNDDITIQGTTSVTKATSYVNLQPSGGNVGIGTTAPGALLDLGTAGTTAGVIRLAGATSDNVSISSAATAGAWTLTLPTSGGTDGYVLKTNGSGTTTWISPGSIAASWSSLTAPSANLALSMAAYTSTFTYNATTGAGANLFNLTDTANNTGTGYLMDLTTANASVLNPLHVNAAGVEALTVTKDARIGVGIVAPTSKVQIVGSADIQQLLVKGNAAQTTNLQEWQNSAGNIQAALNISGATNNLFKLNNSTGVAGLELRSGGAGLNNTFVGSEAGKITTGTNNAACGYQALQANTTGGSNAATGFGALYSNTTASFNTADGYWALYTNTIGTNNTAQGAGALKSNTIGSYNTAQGTDSLFTNTEGLYNTAGGWRSLWQNIDGDGNTAYGSQTLYTNSTGVLNTAIGTDALHTNGDGIGNTAEGYQALYANTGDYNTATGHGALFKNTTANNNTAHGTNSLYNNTTGIDLTAQGFGALYNNTDGIANSAQGADALFSNTTGDNNTAQGKSALYHNTTSGNNTAQGYYALFNNDGGIDNTAQGVNALFSNTTGSENCAQGFGALYNNIDGINNVAHGNSALFSSTSDDNNTATGTTALYTNDGGWINSAYGFGSLYSVTTGDANTAIGNNSGRTLTTGNSNTFLGHEAGYNASQKVDAVNSTAIGAGSYATLDNQVVVGNTSVVETLLRGNVGIGMTPTYQLQLSTDSAAKPGTNTWTIASDMRVKNDIIPYTDGLNVITKINPVNYHYNGKAGLPEGMPGIGIIAQDMQKVAPYTISSYKAKLNPGDKQETELLNFNSGPLTFTLINAVKEQQEEIEAISDRVDLLSNTAKGSYVPSGTADNRGTVGAMSHDNSYLYVKTPEGWKRAPLETF